MTNLNFQAKTPKNQLGQPAVGPVAADEGNEDPLFDQPRYSLNIIQARAPKNQLGQTAVASNEGNEDPPIDQPKYSGKSTNNQLGQTAVAGNNA